MYYVPAFNLHWSSSQQTAHEPTSPSLKPSTLETYLVIDEDKEILKENSTTGLKTLKYSNLLNL